MADLTGQLSDARLVPAQRGTALPGLLIILAFTLFVTNLDLFLSVRGIVPLNTLILFVAFGAVFGGVSLMSEGGRTVDRLWLAVEVSRLPLGLFALLIIAHVITAGRTILSGDDIDYAQIFPIFQFAVLGFGLLIAAADRDGLSVTYAARIAIVVLGGSVVVETFVPGLLGSPTGRSGGFALNANIPGFIIPALLAVSLDFRRLRASDMLVMLAALVAVTSTLSRMGLGLLAIVFGAYLVFQLLATRPEARLRKLVWIGSVGAALVTLVVAGLSFFADAPGLDRELQTRIGAILRGGDAFNDPYRAPLLEHFLQLAARSPWVGHAAGETLMNATARAPLQLGPHNMFVRTWIDAGILGLALYMAFLASITGIGILRKSVPATLMGILVALYSLFSHNVMDNKAVMILIGVALGQSALRRTRG